MMIAVEHINSLIVERFRKLLEQNRLAHAYLFMGPSGIGKAATAMAIAKMINCEGKPGKKIFCGQCSSCVLVDKGQHPDVFHVPGSHDEPIKIDKVRELLDKVKLKPFMSKRKVFILDNAEFLTADGANALLKTLEEPSSSNMLILVSSAPERMLDTVKSRCHKVTFQALSENELEASLVNQYHLGKQEAHFLAFFCEGCLGKAITYHSEKMGVLKNEVIDQFIFGQDVDAYIKRVLSSKETTQHFLDVLMSWIRDAYLVKAGVRDKRLIHMDRLADLEKFEKPLAFSDLNEIYKEIIKAYQLFSDDLNVRMTLLIIKELLWVKS